MHSFSRNPKLVRIFMSLFLNHLTWIFLENQVLKLSFQTYIFAYFWDFSKVLIHKLLVACFTKTSPKPGLLALIHKLTKSLSVCLSFWSLAFCEACWPNSLHQCLFWSIGPLPLAYFSPRSTLVTQFTESSVWTS